MGVVIVLAMQGLITLEAGIALALGANIGTCVTAGLASLGKPREAVRVAVCNIFIQDIRSAYIASSYWAVCRVYIRFSSSPSPAEGLTGMQAAASVLPRQVANAHTLFNVGIGILFLPLVTQFSRPVFWLVPDRPLTEVEEIHPKYLSEMLLHTPSLALDAARHEIKRMGKRVDLMNSAMMPAVLNGNREALQAVREMDEEVDILLSTLLIIWQK